MKIAALIFGCLFWGFQGFGQDSGKIAGTWMGKITSGDQSFRIVLNITSTGGALKCTLDSPDQGAANLPVKGVTVSGRTVKVDASNLSAAYSGAIQPGDTTISGSWVQEGASFPLMLVKQSKAVRLSRPQEPVAPFPYTSTPVTIENMEGRSVLSGMVTIPKGKGPFPAVVLLSDTGPHNMDAEVLGHKPFWVLADYLARNGIASIRFDDRGVGKSSGNFKNATTQDFASDAKAALKLLLANPKVNKKRVGLLGHGEGGLVAAMVASEDARPEFVVLLGSLGLSGEDILTHQYRAVSAASGVPESIIAETERINKAMYSIVKSEKDNARAVDKLTEMAWAVANSQESLSSDEKQNVVNSITKSFPAILSPWYRSFLTINPSAYYAKVKVPVLILSGGHDLEVAADENTAAIESALRDAGNTHFKSFKFDDLNHLFQHSKTGLPAEYGMIEETISPDVLRVVTEWIKSEVTPSPVK